MTNSTISLNSPVPFGKYRGKPLQVLVNDTNYTKWLVTQRWFKRLYPLTHSAVINHLNPVQTTPTTPDTEEKKMRVRSPSQFTFHVYATTATGKYLLATYKYEGAASKKLAAISDNLRYFRGKVEMISATKYRRYDGDAKAFFKTITAKQARSLGAVL